MDPRLTHRVTVIYSAERIPTRYTVNCRIDGVTSRTHSGTCEPFDTAEDVLSAHLCAVRGWELESSEGEPQDV